MKDRKEKNQDQMIRQDDTAENRLPVPGRKKEHHLASDLLLQFLKSFRKRPLVMIGALLFAFSLAFCLFIAPKAGTAAGTAIGSFRGVTQGIAAGAKAGKDQGLSAEDTVVTIGTKMAETGNLQVMLADLRLSVLHLDGPEKHPKYAALLEMKGEGVFTVDLTQAEAVYDASEDQINITIPEPVFTPYLDDSTLDVLAEYQPWLRDGSTADGYISYLNSRERLEEEAQEKMSAMIEPAKASALTQVELLARSICGSSASIQVDFAGGEM